MDGNGTRRTVVHGLRHRESGRMVRVRSETVVLQDEPYLTEDTKYHMTLDEEHPVFDAGSREELAWALLSRSGSCERHPNPGALTPDDVEAVVVETVVTRALERIPVDFAVSTVVRGVAHDLDRRLAKVVPDLQPYLDALAEHATELASGKMPGSEWGWDPARLVAIAVPRPADGFEGLAGGLVDQGGGCHRRALGAVDLPDRMSHLALWPRGAVPGPACLLVCLQDSRPLPEGFLDAVSGPAPASGP